MFLTGAIQLMGKVIGFILNMPSHTEQDPPLPWSAFLDQAISEPIELHCIGGFVVSLLYGLPRPNW